MRSQDMIYASGIKGYCPTYVCWQYLHDISAQLVENDERDKYEAIALNNVRINGKNFCLIEKSCLKDIGYDDVRQLATSAFELILGIPMFNGIGEKIATSIVDYLGEDALNKNYKGIAFFSDYSWYDGKIYVDGNGVTSNSKVDEETLNEKNEYVDYLIKKNDWVLKYDYFKYLNKKTN